MICGYNPSVFYILPMLGKHPDELPRFRDCFIGEDKNTIEIYTRVGGNNRGCGFGEEKLIKHPNFIKTYDDDFDNTYGTYVFSVPDRWRKDFDKIKDGRLFGISDEYFNEIIRIYPKIEDELRKQFERPKPTKDAQGNNAVDA